MNQQQAEPVDTKQEQPPKKPTTVNAISFNMLSDGHVNVSGPITSSDLVADVLGKGLNGLFRYYAKEGIKENLVEVVPADAMPR